MHFFLKTIMSLLFCILSITVNAQAGNITESETKCVHEETERLMKSNTGEAMQQDLQALGAKCGSDKHSAIIDVIMNRLLPPVILACFKDKDDEYKQVGTVETIPIIKSIAVPRSCIQLDQLEYKK